MQESYVGQFATYQCSQTDRQTCPQFRDGHLVIIIVVIPAALPARTIIFLVFVLNYVVYLALGAFLYLGQSLLSIFVSPYLAVALYEGGVVLASALTHPILQIAIVLVYFDLRVRKEALDLFQLAQHVAAPA